MTAKGEKWDYVMNRAPALQKLMNDFGDMTLWEYAHLKYRYSGSVETTRKAEFLEYIGNYIEKTHGKIAQGGAIKSLSSNYCVSTADHHGPIGHPFFFQSAIMRGLARPGEAIVNLCTSHVSLGNSSYPRGFVLHDEVSTTYTGLPFFRAKERMSPVFGQRAFERKDIERYILLLRDKNISQGKYQALLQWAEKNLLSDEILSEGSYSEQITIMNAILWNDIFGDTLPPLITLDGEKIVSEILCQHLQRDTSLLKNIMTEISWQDDIECYFDTVGCCFDKKNQRGTYLFWHIDADSQRSALWRDGNMLTSREGGISIPLEAEGLCKALEDGELIPSGLLMYTTLACYYGVTCFGGFAQGTYLPQIFAAYEKLAQQMGESVQIQTSILCEDIVLLRDEKERIMTALDMFLEKDKWDFKKLLQNAKSTTLSDSISMMLPEIARCV